MLAQTLSNAWMQSWQIILMVAVVWSLSRLIGQRVPYATYLLWLAVMIRCLVPPLVTSPASVFRWFPRDGVEVARVSGMMVDTATPDSGAHGLDAWNDSARGPNTAVAESLARGGSGINVSPTTEVHPEPIVASRELETESASRTEALTAAPRQLARGRFRWQVIFVGCWGFVGGIYFFGGLVRAWLIARQLRRCHKAAPDWMQDLAKDVARRLGVRRDVPIWIVDSAGPAVFGIVRPRLVLPHEFAEKQTTLHQRSLEMILAHEMLHVRRHDLIVGFLQFAGQATWWFNPFVFWASRRLTAEIEQCCDHETIAFLDCKPTEYARCLLHILERQRRFPHGPAMRAMTPTVERVRRILQLSRECPMQSMPRSRWLALLLVLLVFLPAAPQVAGQTKQPMGHASRADSNDDVPATDVSQEANELSTEELGEASSRETAAAESLTGTSAQSNSWHGQDERHFIALLVSGTSDVLNDAMLGSVTDVNGSSLEQFAQSADDDKILSGNMLQKRVRTVIEREEPLQYGWVAPDRARDLIKGLRQTEGVAAIFESTPIRLRHRLRATTSGGLRRVSDSSESVLFELALQRRDAASLTEMELALELTSEVTKDPLEGIAEKRCIRTGGVFSFQDDFALVLGTISLDGLSQHRPTQDSLIVILLPTIVEADSVPAASTIDATSDFQDVTLKECIETAVQHSKVLQRPVKRWEANSGSFSEAHDTIDNLADTPLRGLVVDVQRAYFDLYLYYRQLESTQNAQDAAVEFWKQANSALDEGAPQASAEVEAQGREQYFFCRGRVEEAKRDMLKSERQLRYLMGVSPSNNRLLRPIDAPSMKKQEYVWEELLTAAINHSAAIKLLTVKHDDQRAQLGVLLQELAKQFGERGSSSRDTQANEQWNQITQLRQSAERLERGIDDAELEISHRLTDAVQNLNASYTLARTAFLQNAAARRQMEALRAKFGAGTVTGDLVLDAQRRAMDSERALNQSQVQYQLAIYELDYTTGRLPDWLNVRGKQ